MKAKKVFKGFIKWVVQPAVLIAFLPFALLGAVSYAVVESLKIGWQGAKKS